MPLLAGAVTFARLRASAPRGSTSDPKRWLLGGLKRHAFQPLAPGAEEDAASGFVELDDHDATGFTPGAVLRGEHALVAWRTDAIRVPPAAVKAELARWVAAFEGEHGRPAGRREKAEARTAIRGAIRQRTAPVTRTVDVSLHLKSREVLIWAASRKAVEEVATALREALGLELEGHVPAALAGWRGVDAEKLSPTAELVGADLRAEEVADDAA